jgi:hypothetical protein
VSVSWDTLRALGLSVPPREQRNGTVAVKAEFAIRADSTPPMLKLDTLRDVKDRKSGVWVVQRLRAVHRLLLCQRRVE